MRNPAKRTGHSIAVSREAHACVGVFVSIKTGVHLYMPVDFLCIYAPVNILYLCIMSYNYILRYVLSMKASNVSEWMNCVSG